MLAELQGAQPSDQRPAITWREARAKRGHASEAVSNDLEEMTVGDLSQPIRVICGRRRKSAAHDYAVSVTDESVAVSTEDSEPFAPVFQEFASQRQRRTIHRLPIALAASHDGIVWQFAARDCPFDRRTHRHS